MTDTLGKMREELRRLTKKKVVLVPVRKNLRMCWRGSAGLSIIVLCY